MPSEYVKIADAVSARSPFNPSEQKTVTSAKSQILAADPRRKGVFINNLTALPVYVGPTSGLTSSLFFGIVPPLQTLVLEEADCPEAEWFALTASGSATLVIGTILSDSTTPAEA